MKLKLGGIDYFIEEDGSGYPLLLLHGFTGSLSSWYPFIDHFGKTSKMLMVDLIGHGQTQSPEQPSRYDILKVAADMKELLDVLEIEKTDLLGYSMGGRLAITFAATYPERVRKLVLESTSPGLKTEVERKQRRKQDARLADKILEEGIPTFVDYWEKIPLFESHRNLSPKVRETLKRQRMRNNPIGLANSLLGMGTGSQPSWWEDLRKFGFETLILTGDVDVKYCRIGEEMAKFIPEAEWISMKNVGHTLHVEEPEKFGTIVSGFLTRNR